MARATRSSKPAEAQAAPAPTPSKATPGRGGKKRKRASVADPDGQPALKQRRSASARDDELDEQEPASPEPDAETLNGEDEDVKPNVASEDTPDVKQEEPEPSSVGDLPLDAADAQKLLDVLEMKDKQGLLDRIFPLPADAAGSSTTPQSVSLRTLLQDSPNYPVRILQSAIHNLLPISTQPRSRPSAAATTQLRFCQLALSLLNEVSAHVRPAPRSLDVFSNASDHTGRPAPTPQDTQYALLQRLPTGDWWTSLSAPPNGDAPSLPTLRTGHAELVAVVPAPPSSLGAGAGPGPSASGSAAPVPTLGSLHIARAPRRPFRASGPRALLAGAYADHGPYGAFAPVYDGPGADLGPGALRALAWDRDRRRAVRDAAFARIRGGILARQPAAIAPIEDLEGEAVMAAPAADAATADMDVDASPQPESAPAEVDALTALDGLLPPEEIVDVQATLDGLAVEAGIQDLLERNARGIMRLQLLQLERLNRPAGGTSKVEEGSDEWETAHAVEDTLVLLASLRPQAATSAGDPDAPAGALTPSAATLHALQRSLPATTTSHGWRGTLPPTRPRALRDDRTLHVKPGVPAPAPQPARAPATPAAAVPSTPATPGTPGGYAAYPFGTYGSALAQYPYAGKPAAGHPYAAWYGGYGAPPTGVPGATSYANFWGGQPPPTPGAPAPPRAVANTVAPKPYAPAPGWAGAAPTLPPHLRGVAPGGVSAPGTPAPMIPVPAAGHGYPAYAAPR